MHNVIVEKPYEFIPPSHRAWLQTLILKFLPSYLWKNYGIASHEIRHLDRLRESIDAGHGVMITANHARPCDPMACGWLCIGSRVPMYCMASWHLFHESRFQHWLIRACGGYSVYREGTDTSSVNFTVKCLTDAVRPIVIFAEGAVTRSNDVVFPVLDGPALVARLAARRRAKKSPSGKVVIHPVAMKYFFQGDLNQAVTPVLERIEQRLSWQTRSTLPLLERLGKLADALLCLRELEYFGAPQAAGNGLPGIQDRIESLIERIIRPVEEEWAPGDRPQLGVYARVQRLRGLIMNDMVSGDIAADERARRWRQLTDIYVAGQLGCYPRDYLAGNPSPERILETVEKIEEDLTDKPTIHKPMHLVMQVGETIEVSPKRERGAHHDPLAQLYRTRIADMIEDINSNPPEQVCAR
jgi:1-acyl-sn-glycerol-3-phosphate acyltransferase